MIPVGHLQEYMEYKNDLENMVNLKEFRELKEEALATAYGNLAALNLSMGELSKALEFGLKDLLSTAELK